MSGTLFFIFASCHPLTRPIRRTQFSEDIPRRNYDFLDSDQAQGEPGQHCTSNKFPKYIVTMCSIFVAGAYFTAVQILRVGPLSTFSDHLEDNARVKYQQIITMCVYVPLGAINVLSLIKLHNYQTNIPVQSQLTSSGYMLLFHVLCFFYNMSLLCGSSLPMLVYCVFVMGLT